jgi:uncharacterized surface anchored protein
LTEDPISNYQLTSDIPSGGFDIGDETQWHFTFTATNSKIFGELRLHKTGVGGAALAGAGFVLYVDDNKNGIHEAGESLVQDSGTTDSNGNLTFSNIPFGYYVLKESIVPSGYIAVPDQPVVISTQGQVVTFDNLQDSYNKGSIQVIKHDQDGVLLGGAVFRLQGPSFDDTRTAVDGSITWSNLEWGTYTLSEVSPPPGYSPDPSFPITNIVIDGDHLGPLTYTATNTQLKGSISVLKLDAATGAPLSGVTFSLWKGGVQVGSSLVTDSSGTVGWANLDWGTYTVVEDSAPPGYIIGPPQSGTINGTSLTISFTFYNTLSLGSVSLSKAYVGSAPLGPVSFILSGPSGSTKTLIGSGTLVWDNLSWGTYTLSEEVPTGYSMVGLPQTFTIDGDNLSFTFTATNTQNKGSIEVYKRDAETGALLSGASFKLEIQNGTNWDFVGENETDATGMVSWTNLEWGTYRVTETKVPTGYTLITEPQVKTLDANTPDLKLVFEFRNPRESGTIEVLKTSLTGSPLAGATFSLNFKTGDNWIKLIGSEKQTGANGKVSWTGLAWGEYKVVEESAPTGYVKASPDYQTGILNAETPDLKLTFTFTNTPVEGSLTLKKLGAGGTALAGAEFTLFKDDGVTVIQVGTTAADGTLSFTGIPYGNYILKETKAPEGYELLSTTWNVVIDSQGEVVELGEIANTPITGSVSIHKTGIGGAALPGVGFTLYQDLPPIGALGDLDLLNSVASGFTDENGNLTFSGIPYGHYILVETLVPNGYMGSANQFIFIETQGQNLGYELANTRITGSMTLTKVGPEGVLSGAKFALFDSFGNQIKEGTTGSDGTLTFTGISYGSYVLREIQAPEGYLPPADTSWDVVIDSQGETVNLGTISNTLITGSVTLRKITSTGTPLAGAEFTLYASDGVTVIQVGTTGADGTLSFSGIPYGSYVLKETKAPEGYELLSTTWNVVIDSQGKVVNIGDVVNTVPPTPTSPQTPSPTPQTPSPTPEVAGETATPPPSPTPEVAGETALPVTGVPISYLFGIGGILLILGGVLFLVLKKSKKEDF